MGRPHDCLVTTFEIFPASSTCLFISSSGSTNVVHIPRQLVGRFSKKSMQRKKIAIDVLITPIIVKCFDQRSSGLLFRLLFVTRRLVNFILPENQTFTLTIAWPSFVRRWPTIFLLLWRLRQRWLHRLCSNCFLSHQSGGMNR